MSCRPADIAQFARLAGLLTLLNFSILALGAVSFLFFSAKGFSRNKTSSMQPQG
jgi:hypothetical protein